MKSIRNRIAAMTLIITFIVATGMALYSILRIDHLLGDTHYRYAESLGTEIALEIDAYMAKHKGYLEGQVKALIHAKDYSKTHMATYTKNMAEGQEDVLYVYFNTPKDDGHMTSSDGWEPAPDYSWQENEWLKITLSTDEIYIGPPAIDSVTEKLVAVLRQKITDQTGTTHGVLNMAVSLEELSNILAAYELPGDARAMVLYEDGGILAYHDPTVLSGKHNVVPNILDYAPGFKLDQTSFEINDKTYMAVPLKESGWYLYLGVSNAFLSSGTWQTLIGFLLLYTLAGIVTLIYVRHYSKKITTPITALTVAADAIAKGDYDTTLSEALYRNNDEISTLSRTFEDMRSGINERTMELQALYEEMAAAEETLRENYDELARYKDEVEYYAFNNIKTQLPNKERLLQRMEQLWKHDKLIGQAIFIISFDELTHYFQTLGQSAIEAIHQHFGQHINAQRESLHTQAELYDLSNGRYLILTPEVPHINEWLETLQTHLATLKIADTLYIRITLTTGAFLIPDKMPSYNEATLPSYIEYAEAAIQAKTRLKWFDDDMYQRRLYDTQIENHLHHAVEKNELYVVYQPKFDANRKMIGAEALVRWQHQKLGNIPPSHFIPIAEASGLIDVIDRFVAKTVVEKQAQRRDEGLPLVPIAINLSILELIDPKVIEKLSALLASQNIPHDSIAVEVTETAFSKHLDIASENIAKLKKEGYNIHLDDFGTGYSSLSYLKHFEIDAIKIDISFTRRIIEEPKVESIVKSIIGLSHSIGAKVIAEGVETEEQFERLKMLNCDYFQGYYFARPEREF